jgi:hypothetical protein
MEEKKEITDEFYMEYLFFNTACKYLETNEVKYKDDLKKILLIWKSGKYKDILNDIRKN